MSTRLAISRPRDKFFCLAVGQIRMSSFPPAGRKALELARKWARIRPVRLSATMRASKVRRKSSGDAALRLLSLETYEVMRENGISFYNVHAPLDMHPEVSPSRLGRKYPNGFRPHSAKGWCSTILYSQLRRALGSREFRIADCGLRGIVLVLDLLGFCSEKGIRFSPNDFVQFNRSGGETSAFSSTSTSRSTSTRARLGPLRQSL